MRDARLPNLSTGFDRTDTCATTFQKSSSEKALPSPKREPGTRGVTQDNLQITPPSEPPEELSICVSHQAKEIATKLLLNGKLKKQILAMRKLYYQEVARQAKEKIKEAEDKEEQDKSR